MLPLLLAGPPVNQVSATPRGQRNWTGPIAKSSNKAQRRRDDNKNRILHFRGGPWGQRGESSKNAVFRGKRHDNKILKVQILLSRNFVVITQAPKGR